MSSERERAWLAEWEEEREAREQELFDRQQRYLDEPAFLLLDPCRKTMPQVFLVLKCEYYRDEDTYHLHGCGRLTKVFASALGASEYLDALPGHGDLIAPDPSRGDWWYLRYGHRIIELPLVEGEEDSGESCPKGQGSRAGKVYVLFRGIQQVDSGLPLAVFLSPNQAEAFRKECFKAYQATQSPLRGTLDRSTSMPEELFTDWLLDLGLEPPPPVRPGQPDWRRWPSWWKAIGPALTEWQRSRIWQVMDRIAPYNTIEVDSDELLAAPPDGTF